ncbi:MAG: phosphoribosylanthranilate isomerase, partial [Thermodesulfobacteriota bacterium]
VLTGISTSKKIILSGGLTPENVSRAIETVKPYGVDVSTGVEDSPGKKNHIKMRKFIEAVKNGG